MISTGAILPLLRWKDGGAVLAVSSADVAGEDLVRDVASLAVPGAAAQGDGAAAGALGYGLVRDQRAHGLEHGLGHHQRGGHVGVHRGGVVGADHGALAEAGLHHPRQALVSSSLSRRRFSLGASSSPSTARCPSCICSRRRLGGDMRHHAGDYRGPVGVSSIVYLGMNAWPVALDSSI